MSETLALALKLFMAYRALSTKWKQNQAMTTGNTYQTVTDKDTALMEVKNKAGSVSVLIGTRDTGKSVCSRRLARFYDRPTYIVSPQEETPGWMHAINFQDIEQGIPEYSTLILDDIPAYAGNRQYSNETVQLVERIVPMVRHPRQPPEFPIGRVHLIFCTQSSAQADKYILDCDLAIFKPLGLLIEERPNVARIYKNFVNPVFEGKDTPWIKSHGYLMTPTWRGVIEIKMTN